MNNMFLNNSNFEKLRNFLKTRLYNFKRSLQIRKLINYYGTIKRINMYNPSLNNNKYLTIIACHTNSDFKYNNLINTIKHLSFDCNDLVIINSTNLKNSSNLVNLCSEKNIKYIEINNDFTYDFGKWIYALNNIKYDKYDYILLVNDSIIILDELDKFFKNLKNYDSNINFYGYNDSNQENYHYQTYLFFINTTIVNKFINFFESKKFFI
jgi:hypothetical protein